MTNHELIKACCDCQRRQLAALREAQAETERLRKEAGDLHNRYVILREAHRAMIKKHRLEVHGE